MDTVQWPQEIVVKPIEEIVTNPNCPKPNNNNNNNNNVNSILERKIRGQKEQALNCPRCNSTNTKFCYYNNYSLTQPRYFCKACRRYWTEGGSLRNIPVGGGSRKNKRPSSSSSSISTTPTPNSQSLPNKINLDIIPQNPKTTTQDLNLFFPPPSNHHHHHHHHFTTNNNLNGIVVDLGGTNNPTVAGSSLSTSTVATTTVSSSSPHRHQPSAMELLTGMASSSNNNNSRGLNCFVPMPHVVVPNNNPGSVYTVGFPDLHDQFKPSLGFSLDGYGVVPTEASNGEGRLMQLPFEDLRQGSNDGVDQQGKEQGGDHHNSSGYWSGMLGGGSW